MKKTLKFLIIGSSPFLLILLFTLSFNVIKNDWLYAHKSLYTFQAPFDWFTYKLKTKIIKSIINLRENNKQGLPIKKIYIDEKLQNELLLDVPHSTKHWKKGFYLDNNEIKNIEIRFRGDNSRNWLLEKKHWRIKTQKKNLINKQRYFDYLPFDHGKFLSGRIANSLGILSPKFNLVELFINDQSSGIYIESENINESFLRKNFIMPVNVYKVEQILNESIVALEPNAFISPGVLSKRAVFNQVSYSDKSDFIYFYKLMRSSIDNKKKYLDLIDKIGIENWVKFAVYQIVTQNFHNDNSHNFRLVSDPWSGHLIPIVYDPLIGSRSKIDQQNYDLDISSNDMFLLLNKGSYFQDLKFNQLYKILKSDLIEKEIASLINKETENKISENRDVELIYQNFNIFNLLSGIKNKKYVSEKSTNLRKNFYNKFLLNKKNLIKYLEKKPDVNWFKKSYGFDIFVNGNLPVSNLKIYFINKKPKWIAIDLNENGVIDNNEEKIFPNDNDNFYIPYTFYANRISSSSSTIGLLKLQLKIAKTRFKILTDESIKPNSIEFQNAYTKKIFYLNEKNINALPASVLNYPIKNEFNKKNKQYEKITLSGIIEVDKTHVFNKPVIIEAGTVFKIKKNKSLIFKNQVLAQGTESLPIKFQKFNNENWGTLALQGKNTENSIFENVIINGGSGDTSSTNIRYISAFSIHKTQNIKLKNLKIINNNKYDDAIHIVYSENIRIDNINIQDAFSDAIDFDMSKNITLINSEIINPGNDSVDMMESSLIIDNCIFKKSNDKAISVGENSFLILNNSKLSENNFGVSTKDGSLSLIYYSKFLNNNTDINNYKKNWRYGDGGITKISKSVFKNNLSKKKNNKIKKDKFSTISISESFINDKFIKDIIYLEKNSSNHVSRLKKFNYDKVSKMLIDNDIILENNN